METKIIDGEKVDVYGNNKEDGYFGCFTEFVFEFLVSSCFKADKYDVTIVGGMHNLSQILRWIPSHRQFVSKSDKWDDFAEHRVISQQGIAVKLRFDESFGEDEIGIIAKGRKLRDGN